MEPLVSVYMTTYYHEKYIKKALDSILSQVTNFTYEIVVSDDCSKDGTVNILKKYEEKYDKIRLNINEKNVGLTQNMYLAKQMCKGKYVAFLSGDDYWIDNYKLQKQVDFLERHTKFVGVATVIEERVDDALVGSNLFPKSKKQINKPFTLDMFLRGYNCPLASIMTINFYKEPQKYPLFSKMPEISHFIDDVTDSVFILLEGDVFQLADISSAYRVRRNVKNDRNFNSQNKELRSYVRHIEMLNNLNSFMTTVEPVDLFYRYRMVCANGFVKSIMCRCIRDYWDTYRTVPEIYKKRYLFLRSLFYIPNEMVLALNIRLNEKKQMFLNKLVRRD